MVVVVRSLLSLSSADCHKSVLNALNRIIFGSYHLVKFRAYHLHSATHTALWWRPTLPPHL
jgi:hypothetical protein